MIANLISLGGMVGVTTATQIVRVVGATAFVAVLAYFAVRLMAISRGRGRRGTGLYVVESVAVGQAASVALIKVGEKYMLVGVTKERVTLLGNLDKDDYAEPVPGDAVQNVPFGSILSRFLQTKSADGADHRDEEYRND